METKETGLESVFASRMEQQVEQAEDIDPGLTEAVKLYRIRLRRLRRNKEGDKWLQVLYASLAQQFISDNSRIWTIGQWMISLSLAPMVVLPAVKQNLLPATIFLAIPSISIIWIWYVIANHHRIFQERSKLKMDSIEAVLSLDVSFPKDKRTQGVLRMRKTIVGVITAVWVLTIIVVALYTFLYNGSSAVDSIRVYN
jgi:hypothetical protein